MAKNIKELERKVMNDTLKFFVDKYNINIEQRSPIEIPNVDREILTQWWHELDFKIGVEVGVERAVYSKVICKNNPQLERLYLVDPWTAYRGYREHVSQEKLDGFFEITSNRTRDWPFVEIIREFSSIASARFDDESLDFVYLDGNHEFRQVVNDISDWYPKVKKGGIISGHDFIRRKNPDYLMGVVEAVTGFTQAYHIAPWFVLGRKDMKDGELRDTARSWMWIKP